MALCVEYETISKEIIKTRTLYKEIKLGKWLDSQKSGTKGKGMMNKARLTKLLTCSTFNQWYINHQNEFHPEFQYCNLKNNQQIIIKITMSFL